MKKFEGVANTLFVPLVARIAISKEFPEYFYDLKALELEPDLPQGADKGASQYTNMAPCPGITIWIKWLRPLRENMKPAMWCT